MQSLDVLVVGSANLDLVFNSARLPTAGETVLGGRFESFLGGKGANQAVAAARLGCSVSFCGLTGDDANGELLRAGLGASGVDLRCCGVVPGVASGTAGIFVGSAGENQIVVAPGANASLEPSHVRSALSLAPKVVISQLEVPLSAVEAASKADIFVLNPAPATVLPPGFLQSCFVVTPNESEAGALTGLECPESMAADLVAQGARHAIVTLGPEGCIWATATGIRRFAAHKVDPVDTTAAGDAFNGAFAFGLAKGLDVEDCVMIASAVAALSVTKPGAQTSMPTLEEAVRLEPRIATILQT